MNFHHRFKAEKLIKIIDTSIRNLSLENEEIEIEYQGDTIGKYDLDFNGEHFLLQSKNTSCRANDSCNTQVLKKVKQKLSCC